LAIQWEKLSLLPSLSSFQSWNPWSTPWRTRRWSQPWRNWRKVSHFLKKNTLIIDFG
jgi:hypothetical protein